MYVDPMLWRLTLVIIIEQVLQVGVLLKIGRD